MSSLTYVEDGNLATPANMNEWLNQAAGNIYSARAFGALADGNTDDTSAIQLAASAANAAGGGIVSIEPNTVYSISNLSAYPNVIYRDASMRTDNSIYDSKSLRLISVVDLNDIDVASGERPRHAWSVLEIVGSTASVTTARADANFGIASVGRRAAPASSDGSGIEQVIANGLYFEHRSDVTIPTRAFGAEIAATVYGRGNVNTARGVHGVAQIAAPGRGSQVGAAGSGTIASGIGVEGSAKINGSGITGRFTSLGVGVQGSITHDGNAYWPTAYVFRGIANVQGMPSGNTLIENLYMSDQTYDLSSSSATITNVYGKYVRDPGDQGNITNMFGIVVDKMSAGSNNKTAFVTGPLHVQRGEEVVLDSGSDTYDENVAGRARMVYNTSTDAIELYNRATGGDPVLSLVSSHIRMPSPATTGPASDATGTKGEMLWAEDSGAFFLYVCTSANSWRRVSLNTF